MADATLILPLAGRDWPDDPVVPPEWYGEGTPYGAEVMACISEGFCPKCRGPLRRAGWCVSCRAEWSAWSNTLAYGFKARWRDGRGGLGPTAPPLPGTWHSQLCLAGRVPAVTGGEQ